MGRSVGLVPVWVSKVKPFKMKFWVLKGSTNTRGLFFCNNPSFGSAKRGLKEQPINSARLRLHRRREDNPEP